MTMSSQVNRWPLSGRLRYEAAGIIDDGAVASGRFQKALLANAANFRVNVHVGVAIAGLLV